MKKWLFVVVGLAVLAAAAVAVRQTGVDVVAMAGFKSSDGDIAKAEGAKPAGGQRNAQAADPAVVRNVFPETAPLMNQLRLPLRGRPFPGIRRREDQHRQNNKELL